MAFAAARAKGRLVVVVDGIEGPEFADSWGDPAFAPDGSRVAYLAQRRATGFLGTGRKPWVLVVDGAESGDWDEVTSNPHFSPDGAHVAFTARSGADWAVVVDDVAGPAYDEVGPPSYEGSGGLVYVARSGRPGIQPGFRVVAGGAEGPVMDDIHVAGNHPALELGPDRRHVASVGLVAGGWRPIVDGLVGPGGPGTVRVGFEGDRAVFLAEGEDGFHRLSIALD